MFSGIVEEIGQVLSLTRDPNLLLWDGSRGEGFVLTVQCSKVLGGAYIGCSIAVNGTCLTVTSLSVTHPGSVNDAECGGTFTVNLAPETIRRTNLAEVRPGDGVNLERALRMSDRNSGHNVQGHIDTTGTILKFNKEGDSLWVHVQVDPSLMRFIVPKGFIAIDGASLTVCETNAALGQFNFMLIAHTQTAVVIPRRRVGDRVNVEVDVVAKYVGQSIGNIADRVEKIEKQLAEMKSCACNKESHSKPAPAPAPAHSTTQHTNGSDGEMKAINAQLARTTHGAGLEVPLPTPAQASGLRVGIVCAQWHAQLICLMRDKCMSRLVELGVHKENILLAVGPGSYELPFIAKKMIDDHRVDVVVCMGILLKGGTIHMEVLAGATTQSMLDLQLATGVPIVFGVLTVLQIEQAVERAESDLPRSWADTAMCMAMHRRGVRLARL